MTEEFMKELANPNTENNTATQVIEKPNTAAATPGIPITPGTSIVPGTPITPDTSTIAPHTDAATPSNGISPEALTTDNIAKLLDSMRAVVAEDNTRRALEANKAVKLEEIRKNIDALGGAVTMDAILADAKTLSKSDNDDVVYDMASHMLQLYSQRKEESEKKAKEANYISDAVLMKKYGEYYHHSIEGKLKTKIESDGYDYAAIKASYAPSEWTGFVEKFVKANEPYFFGTAEPRSPHETKEQKMFVLDLKKK